MTEIKNLEGRFRVNREHLIRIQLLDKDNKIVRDVEGSGFKNIYQCWSFVLHHGNVRRQIKGHKLIIINNTTGLTWKSK